MRILIFAERGACLTGGNKYDSYLFRKLEENGLDCEYVRVKNYKSGIGFFKLFCPIIELYHIRRIFHANICFWNSTSAYRHMVLLMLIRILFPKKKVYIIHHHYQFELYQGVKRLLLKLTECIFLSLSTSIIIPSPYVLSRTKKLLTKKKIHFIELSFKESSRGRKSIFNSNMLYVGTIEFRKGLHLLLESLYMLKNEGVEWKLRVVGAVVDKGYYSQLLSKIKQFNLTDNVEFLGRISDFELNQVYEVSDVFVFPSLLEGYGLVLIEAMSHSLPVIAFNNSAMPYTVSHNSNGLLVENMNVKMFAEAMKSILTRRELMVKLSNGAFITYTKSRRIKDIDHDISSFIQELK